MSTLFQRIIGDISPDESKIPIHGIRAMFGEVSRGHLAPLDIIQAYELGTEQQGDLVTFLTKLGSHPDSMYLGMVIFDWLVLAELGILSSVYKDEAAFWVRVDAEITKATA